jgi:hypothetical protein
MILGRSNEKFSEVMIPIEASIQLLEAEFSLNNSVLS